MEILCLRKLTLATRSHIPSNISVKVWPPKTEKEVMGHCEDSLMTKRVMHELNQQEGALRYRDETRTPSRILLKESRSFDEIVGHLSQELLVQHIVKIIRSFKSSQEPLDDF